MRFLRQRTPDKADPVADSESVPNDVTEPKNGTRAYTPGKGRPTPKRRDAEGNRRGPVLPPPRTQREAMKRSRVSKDERRRAAAERRERMAAGDERYLLPRDKGPVKAHVRDLVDARRHLLGLFMPLALLVLVTMLMPSPVVQYYAAPGAMFILVVMIIEGAFLGRYVTKRVRTKFPQATDRGMSLGWYSFVRASQIRKLRTPQPRVKPGETVS